MLCHPISTFQVLGTLASWNLHSDCLCGSHHCGVHHSRLHHGGGHPHGGVHHGGHGGRCLVALGNAEPLQLSSASTNELTSKSSVQSAREPISSKLLAFQLTSDDSLHHARDCTTLARFSAH